MRRLALRPLIPAAAQAGEILDGIRARGTLRVGITGDCDYQPFTTRAADDTYSGADIIRAHSWRYDWDWV